jgi:hypothetical protein
MEVRQEGELMERKRVCFFLLLTIGLFFLSGPACASSDYDSVAKNFLTFLGSDKTVRSSRVIESNALDQTQPKVAVAVLMELDGGGFILISASKNLTPIKAYALSGSYDGLPPGYKDFLVKELEANVRALSILARAPQSVRATENQERWDFLLNLSSVRTPLAYTPETYLLSTRWNQSTPYNKFLPDVGGTKVLAGCVNVALGQIMRYHGYPAAGSGVSSYNWNGQRLKTILYRPFNWQNMPDSLDSGVPEYQTDEVALLLKDLGVVNQTSFGLTESGSVFFSGSFIRHFRYSNTIAFMDNSDVELFFTALRGEINAMRPVMMQFPGHSTVADGYSSDQTGRKIHINMGWGGYENDYYYLDQPVYTDKYVFPPNLTMVYNIMPCSGNDCPVDEEAVNSVGNTTISGTFGSGIDTRIYSLYLKDTTTLRGDRGYSNQAFYIDLYDHGGILLSESDTPINTDLPAGNYSIALSLCNAQSSACYPFPDPGHLAYTVGVVTGTLTPAEKSSVDGSLDFPPVINNEFATLILDSRNQAPYKILIDARDENGDLLNLSAVSTNPGVLQASLSGNVLSLVPAAASNVASRVALNAAANGKTAQKSFIVMMVNEEVYVGKAFTIPGIFENQDDYNTHKVVLDGQCTITGSNGYINQAFYDSVKNSQGGSVIPPGDTTIDHSFTRGIYFIGASLDENPGGPGYRYSFDTVNHWYTLDVRCPNADDSATTLAGLLGVDLSNTSLPESIISLTPGWNFISLPKVPQAVAIATVLASVSPKVRIVWGYDNEHQVWKKWQRGDQAPSLTTMETGKGYWIYMEAAGDIDMTAWNVMPPGTLTHLYTGWNLTGYTGTEGRDVDDGLNGISGVWSIVWGWANGIWYGKHETIQTLPAPIQPLMTFDHGKAYWIKVKSGMAADWAD